MINYAQAELIQGCNHFCSHCYNHFSDTRSFKPMSKKTLQNIAKTPIQRLTITGGEPLLAKGRLFEAFSILSEKKVSLNSNLSFPNNEIIQKLENENLEYILSSLFSYKPKIHNQMAGNPNAFQKLQKSIYMFKNKSNLRLNMVVTSKNIKDVYQTGLYAKDQGIETFYATPIVVSPGKNQTDISRPQYIGVLDSLLELKNQGMEIGSLHAVVPCMFSQDEREKYKEFYEKERCIAGIETITFSTNGDVRVCSQAQDSYGNINSESLEEIIDNMKKWRDNTYVPEKCAPCDYKDLCRGGCRISAKGLNSSLNSPAPYSRDPISPSHSDQS